MKNRIPSLEEYSVNESKNPIAELNKKRLEKLTDEWVADVVNIMVEFEAKLNDKLDLFKGDIIKDTLAKTIASGLANTSGHNEIKIDKAGLKKDLIEKQNILKNTK